MNTRIPEIDSAISTIMENYDEWSAEADQESQKAQDAAAGEYCLRQHLELALCEAFILICDLRMSLEATRKHVNALADTIRDQERVIDQHYTRQKAIGSEIASLRELLEYLQQKKALKDSSLDPGLN